MTLPVPNQASWAVGETVTAALMNANVRDSVNFLANPPIFVGYQAASQSLASGSFVGINLDTEVVDSYNGHSTTTSPYKYTAQVAGWYWVSATVALASTSSTGTRASILYVNGSSLPYTQSEIPVGSTAGASMIATASLVYLNVGDYVQVCGYQNSGGALATVAGFSSMSVLWAHA